MAAIWQSIEDQIVSPWRRAVRSSAVHGVFDKQCGVENLLDRSETGFLADSLKDLPVDRQTQNPFFRRADLP